MSSVPPGPGAGQPPRDPNAPNPFAESSGNNPFGNQPPSANPYAPGMAAPPQGGHDPALSLLAPINTSGWSIASGYLALFSVLLCFLGPFAILTGVMGLRQCGRNPQMAGKFRCIFGIVLGALTTLGLLLFIVSALAGGMR